MRTIVISPNGSLDPASALRFFAGISAVSLSIAGLLSLQGFWPVLPFAGLELMLLGYCLRLSLRDSARREMVRVDPAQVSVVHRDADGRTRHWNAATAWTRVELQPPAHRGHPSRLRLVSSGRGIELGAGLTEDERLALAERLSAILRPEGTDSSRETE